MKRSRFFLAAVLAALALALAACGSSGSGLGSGPGAGTGSTGYRIGKAATLPASPTLDAIQKRGKIIVGTKFDQPLFGLQNPTTNRVEGFDAEIARILAIRIFGDASKVQFTEAVSKNREPFIQQGKVDVVIGTYTITDKRKKLVDFAGPYYIAGQDIMVKSDNTTIRSVTDLAGKKVCTVSGSTSEANLTRLVPTARPLLLDTYSACGEALNDGRVDAVTTDNAVLSGLVSQSSGAYKLVEKPFTNEPYGVGLKKGDTAFRTFVNDTLATAFANGDWAKAFQSTVGAVQKTTPTPPAIDRYSAS
jgi:glutamate transport system substrate-binding protein